MVPTVVVYTDGMRFSDRVRRVLSPSEHRIFLQLNSPHKLQDFLEKIKINFELDGETNHSPRTVLKKRLAHCFEGAVFAAAVLAFHGHKPLLMDFATGLGDEDHAVALFRDKKYWGAISKTNHNILRYRDAVYLTPRELAMSYFNEYFMYDGRKSLRAYSHPFDLSKFAPEKWITTEVSLDWLMDAVSESRYESMVPPKSKLRRASRIETQALRKTEWKAL